MKHKKAFEIQFNWIFVLVAGAAILTIFALVIFKQKSLSESSTSSIALRSMESVVAGASATTDTSSPITVPDLGIEVDCGKISVVKTSKQYPRMVLFSPSLMKGNKLIWQAMSFSAPYKSSNLLFMTSQQVKYILIGNSDLIKSINKSLPPEINKENFSSYDPAKIKNSNNYKVRFVFDNADISPLGLPPSLLKMPDGDVTALKITGNLDKGSVDFYEDRAGSFVSKGTSHYIGKAALIGAIYADTAEHYECNIRNVFARHGIVSDVHAGRTTALYNDPSMSPECRRAYSDSLSFISSIESVSKNIAGASTLSQSDIDVIIGASESLSNQNKEAQKFSCPMIY
ncbi:MAG TPA: hypothetical protein VJI52_00505 [Candidatus Nanoarchaeia archaeon]|nr:hypothetical protein [Candidatus Nanoarchaeia archaeon]